jgi:pyrroline-5-carboxylate reductase
VTTIGLIGAGNIATALARGWGEPVLVSDPVGDRARALAELTGGEALPGNGELARRADVVVLCHKPAQTEAVAAEIGGQARGVVSVLGGVALERLRAAYGATPVVRVMPSTPVEVAAGVTVHARDPDADPALQDTVLELFGRVGSVMTVDERHIDVAMGLMSCSPAYYALVAEAQVDAAVRHGMPAPEALELTIAAMAGAAALLAHRGDTLAVRREVTSPGGLTARGLAALEDGGLRRAFADAMRAVQP